MMKRFSFWKPDPIPCAGTKIDTCILEPIGNPKDVVVKILTIPQTIEFRLLDEVKIFWDLREGVWMSIKEDDSSLAPGKILSIKAESSVGNSTFHRLYVQVFERFSAVVLDEHAGIFLTPQEFRKRF
jgi:hypothetical protein